MKKRGPIIGFSGLALIFISFIITLSIFPQSNSLMEGNFFLENLFQDMFDEISPETQIFPEESVSFSFTSSKSDVPLLWGLQIIDFQDGDRFLVKITNIFGDSFGEFEHESPIVFEMFVIPKIDTYNLEVKNIGKGTITVIAMFAEDPDNSPVMSDPNSPLMTTLLPLAISGILMVFGIIVIIIGIILSILDWKKAPSRSRNF